jgi:hypothetical protein
MTSRAEAAAPWVIVLTCCMLLAGDALKALRPGQQQTAA